MGTFREHKSIVDRSAADRVRHKKKIEKAIKESIKDVIAEESIIGQNGKKKIRRYPKTDTKRMVMRWPQRQTD